MKQWVAQQARVLHIVALAEEVYDPHEKLKLSGNAITKERKAALEIIMG